MRENQKKRVEDRKASSSPKLESSDAGRRQSQASIGMARPELAQAQVAVQAAGAKAGAYFSSWGTWAAEKRRSGWARSSTPTNENSSPKISEQQEEVQAKVETSSPKKEASDVQQSATHP